MEDQDFYYIEEVIKKAKNRYVLVNVLAKRVHTLLKDIFFDKKLDCKEAILVALKEFKEGKLFYTFTAKEEEKEKEEVPTLEELLEPSAKEEEEISTEEIL